MLCLLCSIQVFAQDAKLTWSKAMANFKKEAKTGYGYNVPQALNDLKGLLPQNPDKAKEAVKEVLDYLSDLMKQDDELKIPPANISGVEDLLKAALNDDTFALMLPKLKTDKTKERQRLILLKVIANHPADEVAALIKEYAGNSKFPLLQMYSISALGDKKDAAAFDTMVSALDSTLWEVRLSAIEALGKLGTDNAVQPLISAMKKENGRLRADFQKVLKQLTGEDHGLNGGEWEQWFINKNNPNKPAQQIGAATTVQPTYYDNPIVSKMLVFVLDVSGSMAEPAGTSNAVESGGENTGIPVPPNTPEKDTAALKTLKEENDKRAGASKMEAAQKELIKTVLALPYDTMFSIVFYSGGPFAWKNELVTANAQNKIDAVTIIAKQGPSTSTNIYDSLEMAMQMVPQKNPKKPAKEVGGTSSFSEQLGGADTIFLLTDGIPNVGKIAEPPLILAEIKKINATRHIIINTIGVGDAASIDESFLKSLASENGGTFIRVK